ncbi:hypothetical protein [Argonema galeatum]|uniref:hypothetical protein n=1 Tax=Argonema galeatum TaxID=2942762 RepID=UPI002010EF6D|nr:hypothetical protein [Argonema galeatum]MCL1465035.1 hypothetical protein [Argonema galeatum A003/A1]
MNPQKPQPLEASGDKADRIAYKQTPADELPEQEESNQNLIYSREIILDYLRLRMCEEVFHFEIVEQIKVKVKDNIATALRSLNLDIESGSTEKRQVDVTFDVEYQIGESPNYKNIVLFRIQISLMKLPIQFTYVTINQIIDCIETFLSPGDKDDVWQPTVEDRIVYMKWDKKAKPIPVLVLEQSDKVPFALE